VPVSGLSPKALKVLDKEPISAESDSEIGRANLLKIQAWGGICLFIRREISP
jgi:hypothetical protein